MSQPRTWILGELAGGGSVAVAVGVRDRGHASYATNLQDISGIEELAVYHSNMGIFRGFFWLFQIFFCKTQTLPMQNYFLDIQWEVKVFSFFILDQNNPKKISKNLAFSF